MALQLTLTLPNSTSGNYVRIGYYHWDRLNREASAHLMLHGSAELAASAPTAPVCLIAKLRLNGDQFDTWLGNTALAGEGVTVLGQLYAAAKVEPLLAGGGLTSIDLSGASDV